MNITTPTSKNPSLLQHFEIMELFHELGHVLHSIVSRTNYSINHETDVERDFVEATSQMLEQWVWDKSQLKYFSKHYSYMSPEYYQTWKEESGGQSQPTKVLPDTLINSLVKSKHVNYSLLCLRVLLFSKFDNHEDGYNRIIQYHATGYMNNRPR